MTDPSRSFARHTSGKDVCLLINTALLKEHLKRFWGLSALLFVCYAFAIVLPIYIDIRRDQFALIRSVGLFLSMENGFMIFSVLFAPVIAVIVLFKFQNQVKSTTVMHSYPLTSNQILTTNALAGMILLVLPLLALCIIMIFPIYQAYSYFLISLNPVRLPVNLNFNALHNSILYTSRVFFITALSFLFYLSLFMVAAMLSGNSIITLLLCAALPLLPIGIYFLASAIGEFYIFGFYPLNNLDDYLAYIHPVLWGVQDGSMFLLVVSYSVIIIAMAAFCVFIANKRAQERAGDSVVFPYVKNALVFILSVCGLLLVGVILFSMFRSTSAMYVGFAIGFFIAYCIAQMIAEKTFNILNKMKDFIKFGAVAVGLLLLLLVSTWSDVFGYERYIPHLEDIEGIQIHNVRSFLNNSDSLTNTALNELLVKDPEIITETIAFHQAIISERGALRRYESECLRDLRYADRDFSVLYKLRNGNVIVRHYHLPKSFIDENDLHGLQSRSQLSISLLQNRPDLIWGINLTLHRDRVIQSDTFIDSQDHVLEFVNVLTKDHNSVIQGTTPSSEFLRVSIYLEDWWWMSILQFNIEYNDHIRDWLLENGCRTTYYNRRKRQVIIPINNEETTLRNRRI